MNKDKKTIMDFSQIAAEACGGEVGNGAEILYANQRARPEHAWMLHDGGFQSQTVLGARWAVNGFPQIVIGAKHAAALAATKYPDEVLEEVRSPWSSWLIEVPSETLWMSDADLKPIPIQRIMVGWSSGEKWAMTAYAHDGMALHRWGATIQGLLSPPGNDFRWGENMLFPASTSTIDERAMLIVGRFIVGVALELASGQNVSRSPKGRAPAWKPRTQGAPPIDSRTYQLKADIRVDCRQELREFLLGTRRSVPAVQHIVRGHWKLQAHGAAMSQRKTIWVQPYWRGPEDSPVALRAHAIRTEASKASA